MNLSKTSPLYLTRFLSAYLVLIYHYGTTSMREALPMIKRFGEPVNYFFFISGFVMIISFRKNFLEHPKVIVFSKKQFLVKRFARIYPMYIFALLVFVLFNYTVQTIDNSISKRIWLEAFGIHRWIYSGSINFPDWSVSCEFFFYFLYALTFDWFSSLPFKKVAALTLILFSASIAFTFYYSKFTPQLQSLNGPFFYSTLLNSLLLHPIFLYPIFMFGCLCGRFYIESPKMVLVEKRSLFIFSISLAAIIVCYKYDIISQKISDAGILCIIYFPFVLSVCSLNKNIQQIFSWPPFIFLGEISYGIYIFQAPAEHYFEYFFTDNKPFTSKIEFFLYSMFLITVCAVLYSIFEVPAKKLIIKLAAAGKKINRNAILKTKISKININ